MTCPLIAEVISSDTHISFWWETTDPVKAPSYLRQVCCCFCCCKQSQKTEYGVQGIVVGCDRDAVQREDGVDHSQNLEEGGLQCGMVACQGMRLAGSVTVQHSGTDSPAPWHWHKCQSWRVFRLGMWQLCNLSASFGWAPLILHSKIFFYDLNHRRSSRTRGGTFQLGVWQGRNACTGVRDNLQQINKQISHSCKSPHIFAWIQQGWGHWVRWHWVRKVAPYTTPIPFPLSTHTHTLTLAHTHTLTFTRTQTYACMQTPASSWILR